MKAALLLLALVASHAGAAILAEAPAQDEAVIYLHDVAGPRVGQAKLAEFVTPAGERTPGCWVSRPNSIAVVFLDGDVAAIDLRSLRKPRDA